MRGGGFSGATGGTFYRRGGCAAAAASLPPHPSCCPTCPTMKVFQMGVRGTAAPKIPIPLAAPASALISVVISSVGLEGSQKA